ncbi:MAG: lytic transglycosylase domain-containing protein [Nevskia sp.]|nr:lytic transglycosylase domain-containing protein [Nevskia sp.]
MIPASKYLTLPIYQAYAPEIAAAESAHGMPAGLMARQGYQESGYQAAVVSGARRSAAGAIGMFQFEPATAAEFEIDPTDPAQAIDGAGRYLAQLRAALGSWDYAVAAYNWGIGNVHKWLRAGKSYPPPAETVTYVANITGAQIA